jgi:N-methylhydantoinase B
MIPDGEAQGEDIIEDDGRGGGPFPIRVTVKKTKDTVTADFSATHAQVMAPINCSIACTKAAVVGSLLATIDPNIPLNSGLMDCIELVTLPGTIVHPTHPAPTFASTADPVDRACEAMLRALGQLVPERVPAGSYSTGNNVTGGGFDDQGKEFLWYIYMAGGCGAHRDRDGSNAEWHLMSNCKNESMETWEVRYPVEFLSYSLLPDSGGAGAMRGGAGNRASTSGHREYASDRHFRSSWHRRPWAGRRQAGRPERICHRSGRQGVLDLPAVRRAVGIQVLQCAFAPGRHLCDKAGWGRRVRRSSLASP